MVERQHVGQIERRIAAPPELIQVLVGPRQVGKTTVARTIAAGWQGVARYAAADLPLPPGPEWITSQWELARIDASRAPTLLILDEVQKVRGWSGEVKRLWDEDRAENRRLQVLLLGSSALLLAKGTQESLAGRFFLHRCPHWNFTEMRDAFGWSLDQWLYFGGYPGAAVLIGDEDAWRRYVLDSLIETVLARDVVALQTIAKPTLLRHLFSLAAAYPAQVVSYTKLLGQLTDAGNTTTLASYLRALEGGFLISGLERFSGAAVRQRGSSPKLIVWNNALVSAVGITPFAATRRDGAAWGRLVENAVGAALIQALQGLRFEVLYWKDRQHEVDFVVRRPGRLVAIEVKSGRAGRLSGLEAFLAQNKRARPLVVGTGGMPLEEFFAADLQQLVA